MTEKNTKPLPSKYKEVRERVLESLENSTPDDAFLFIRDILDYPSQITDNSMWRDVFTLFKRIIIEFGEYDLVELIEDVIESPNNVDVLYNLAYELYEQNLNSIAATLLKRAYEIDPHNPEILSELIINLETLMLNKEIYKILSQSTEILESSEICRYLFAFNSLMIGNIDEPLKILPKILQSEDIDILFMANSLKSMLNRALILKESRSLDLTDLRGWHMVLNGSILLHLSPFGLEEGMHGRYAYISDNYSLIREGINRLKKVLEVSRVTIPAVLALPDRSSHILAIATSKILEVPLRNWEDIDINTPGLIIAYDLDEIQSEEVWTDISYHRPGQILWSHVSCWTKPFTFSPDITTYLYQTNVNPWMGGAMGYDTKEKRVTVSEIDKSTNEDISQRILDTEINEEYLDDLDDLLSIIEPLRNLEDDNKPGIFKITGRRIRQRIGSPVPSNRFL